MRYRDVEKRDSNYPFFVSFGFLAAFLWLIYYFSGNPSYMNSMAVLANLKSLSESGGFYASSEPWPLVCLLYWKKITGLNYIPAYLSLVAILSSLAVHLSLSLFQKGKWKLNQFLALYLIMLIPYIHDLPFKLFNQLFVFNIFLVLLLFVNEITVLAILVFLLGAAGAFLSDLPSALLYVSLFIIYFTLKKSREQKMKTTVFFKKKNIPLISLMVYLALLLALVLQISFSGFFNSSGFSFLVTSWYQSLRYFLPLLGLVFIASFLMNEEKELNNSVSTGIILLVSASLVYFNIGRAEFNQEEMTNRKNGLSVLRDRGVVAAGRKIYSDVFFSNYYYFHTGFKIFFNGVPDKKDFMVLDGVLAADRREIDHNYKNGDYYKYFQIDSRTVLMNRILLERIVSRNLPPATAMLLKEKAEIKPPKTTGYESYRASLIRLFIEH